MSGDVRKQGAYLHAALTMFVKGPWGTHNRSVVVELRRCNFEQLAWVAAVVLSQQGFWIKRIDLARAAVHIQEDHTLSLCRKVRSAFLGLDDHRSQRHSAEAVGGLS
jgi:hypothetical protein